MKKNNYKVFIIMIFIFLIFINTLSQNIYASMIIDNNLENNIPIETLNEEDISKNEIEAVSNISGVPEINARAALVYDRKYKKILYEKNITEKIPNASTTKILTAIVAYENADMNEIVTVSANAASVGGSEIGIRSGNKIVLGELMKGMLIASGNDAATAIAEHVGGNVTTFCNMMNEKAKALGANNTNFVTPHGLDKDEHYTTASDLLIFANYLLDIPYLAEIVNTRNTTIQMDGYTKEVHNTNEMLDIYEEANGIKTGFTGKAGRCLVTAMTKDNRQLISIVLGCDSKSKRTSDSIKLLNYGFNEFEEVDLYKNMTKSFRLNIEKSKGKTYEIILAGKNYVLLPKEENRNIKFEYNFETNLIAPVEKNQKVGNIIIRNNDQIIQSIDIKMPQKIERKGIIDYMAELINKQRIYVQINI